MNDQYAVDNAEAVQLVLTSLVMALHKQGILQISEFVAELGNQLDELDRTEPGRRVNTHERHYYDWFRSLEAQAARDTGQNPG
ncbi:hypothetical protein [Burkholderia gladioli]|uniref:hypothetical protein n=1 Tax=Burkholderia gladioli TaxID=28095 RepID=UPI0016404E4B|nr:hypothetical protein [Burkholderia gladioli]